MECSEKGQILEVEEVVRGQTTQGLWPLLSILDSKVKQKSTE